MGQFSYQQKELLKQLIKGESVALLITADCL
jgi:hypothetical protein